MNEKLDLLENQMIVGFKKDYNIININKSETIMYYQVSNNKYQKA